MEEYSEMYKKIVGNNMIDDDYMGPEQEGSSLKKCSLLDPTEEIGYSDHCEYDDKAVMSESTKCQVC